MASQKYLYYDNLFNRPRINPHPTPDPKPTASLKHSTHSHILYDNLLPIKNYFSLILDVS